ncbi:protein kinase domain-containing protein [Sorangium sp. So ce131]|uniref:serine/threonine protein kinase n=1 Tax=Sorangium sp. So ce131 TaxID=3133282 RepID=UPI003F608C66
MDCPACHQPNIDGARFCATCGALLPVAPVEADPLIGTIVGGRFRIVGVLGEGGMGRVYHGEQPMGTSVRKVAIKTLLEQHAKDPQVVARFMRECGTVSELEHPNTIKVYDFGQTNTGELYIAMELLNGLSLETALERGGALSPERVDRILAQVCGSLQEAHEKGIVHRDLKPANIFLTKRAGEEDYVKVLDFGIAKRDERSAKAEQKLTQQGTVLGTPPYMSPEQFTGKELDARSDIYSLGVMTYEMLTGRLPFEAETPWAWATQHMTAQPFPFETVPMGAAAPAKMKAAVMRALSKNREDRPQSAREFYEDLTIGAGGRLSVLASAPRTQIDAPPGGTAMMPSRPGQTQIGEPLFVAGGPPTGQGRTVVNQHSATVMDQAAMPVGAVPAHPPVPTGSGQVFPAPPPPNTKKSSAAPVIAAIAGALVLGIAGIVLLTRGGGDGATEEGTAPTIALSASASPVTVASDPTVPVPSSAPSAAEALPPEQGDPSKATPDTPKNTPTSTAAPKATTPAGNEKAEQECRAAINLANGGNTELAVKRFAGCDGPRKAEAKSAIGSSAKRAVSSKGCAAKSHATAAARIGVTEALSQLQSRCP